MQHLDNRRLSYIDKYLKMRGAHEYALHLIPNGEYQVLMMTCNWTFRALKGKNLAKLPLINQIAMTMYNQCISGDR
jgi:hypothetical protein